MFSEADLRERVLAMVGCVRSTHGDCGDPMLLARHLGLKVVVSHYDGDQDGFQVEDVVVLGTQQGQTPEMALAPQLSGMRTSRHAWRGSSWRRLSGKVPSGLTGPNQGTGPR